MQAVLTIFVASLGVIAIFYCVTHPKYAIVPVLMLFPIQQIILGYMPEIINRYNWMINVTIGLVAVSAILVSFFRGKPVFEGTKNSAYFAFFSFYLYIFSSILWTPSQDAAVYYLLLGLPYFALMYIAVPLLTRRLEDLENIVLPLILVGVVLMVLMLISPNAKFIGGRFVIDLGYIAGVGEQKSNPLAIADAGGLLAITSAFYRPRKPNIGVTLLQWAGILLGLLLALFSGSRGQVVASLAVIVVLLPFASGARNVVRMVGSLITICVAVGFLFFALNTFMGDLGQSRFTAEGSKDGVSIRFAMVTTLLGAYAANPVHWLTGLGASSFNEYSPVREGNIKYWYPHNIMVESLAEYGVVGILLFGAIVWITTRNCLRLYRLAKGDRAYQSTVAIFAGLFLFQLMISMKQGALLGMPMCFTISLIMGRVLKNEETALAADLAMESNADDYDELAYEGEQAEGRPVSDWDVDVEPAR